MILNEKRLSISKSKAQKTLDDIIEDEVLPIRPDGFGITVTELARKKGMPIETARNVLARLVDKGELTRQRMRYRKITAFVYSKTK